MTIHDAINEYLKQCEARKLSWSTLKAYRCDLEILDRSQRHTELLDIESEELQKIIKGNGSYDVTQECFISYIFSVLQRERIYSGNACNKIPAR